MAMYHSWDSQNPWLRQIHTWNFLHVNTKTAREAGIEDGGWMWVESMHGKVRCLCRYSEAVEPGTVWTWNAIGKASGAWGLDGDANEAKQGFLLNHLISEELAASREGDCISNSDPITGQAGWYDVRVRIYPAAEGEPEVSSPQFDSLQAVPGQAVKMNPGRWLRYFAGKGGKP
jgi:anaerobic selenocysteine-containing dehydrogenase